MNRKGALLTFVVVIAVVIAVIAFVGHRSKTADDSVVRSTDQPVAGEQSKTAVTISGMAFTPSTLTVKKGITVTWTNQDSVKHSVVSDSDSPKGGLSGSAIGQGEQLTFMFATPGTYKYHCGFHPNMTGTIIVTD